MANHPSAQKRARQNIKREERNRAVRSAVKTSIRSFREAVAAGDLEAARTKLATATRDIRKAASKGVIHKATASRRVSRLVKALQARA